MLENILTRWKLRFEKTTGNFLSENLEHGEKNEYKIIHPMPIIENINDLKTDNISFKENYNTFNINDVTTVKSEVIDDTEFLDSQNGTSESLPNDANYNTRYGHNFMKKSYKCTNCKNFYNNYKNLKAHQKYCSKDQHLQSTTPNVDAKTSSKKTQGRRSLRTFICEVCNEKFNKVRFIIDHYISLHSYTQKSIKPYSCDRCDQKFSTLSLLHQHLKYHEKDRSKMCPTCGKSFITSNDLMSHQYIHLNRRNYRCNDCDKAFNTNKNLRTHILVVHTDRSLWRYHCKICDKRFPQKSNFDQHSRRHNGDKQHVCHICQKSFISSSELKRHIQLHSNIKLFKCVPCGTEYKTQRSYKQHVDRKHTDSEKKVSSGERQKKFVCHICPSQFYDRAKLLRHLSRHSGVKPHACSLCDKKFSDKAYLKQHLKVMHGLNEIL